MTSPDEKQGEKKRDGYLHYSRELTKSMEIVSERHITKEGKGDRRKRGMKRLTERRRRDTAGSHLRSKGNVRDPASLQRGQEKEAWHSRSKRLPLALHTKAPARTFCSCLRGQRCSRPCFHSALGRRPSRRGPQKARTAQLNL